MALSLVGHGVPPCWRAYFLLLRQKKVAKEKATPGSAPATPVPCATRRWRGLRNSALRASNSPRPFSANTCVARRLPRGPVNHPAQWSFRFFKVGHFFGLTGAFRKLLEPRRRLGPPERR